MRHSKQKGFTIIEVMLVLALTGLLFVGLVAGFSGNLARQRYKDAVQDVAEQLRSLYSLVYNPQVEIRDKSNSACYGLASGSNEIGDKANVNRGRSNCIVLGVVASIHKDTIETTTLLGRDVSREDLSGKTELQVLQYAQANNLVAIGSNATNCKITTGGEMSLYTMKWGSKLTKIDNKDKSVRATLLIYRSPRNGSIHTYVWDGVVEDPTSSRDPEGNLEAISYEKDEKNPLNCSSANNVKLNNEGIYKYITDANFHSDSTHDLILCVEAGDGMTYDGHRRQIRVHAGGSSSLAVELIDTESDKFKQCQ